MAGAVPTSANDFIEHQLHERLSLLEQAFDADALCIVGPLSTGVDDLIRIAIENLRRRDEPNTGLAVFLTTYGGYIETVQRIVETLRHHYDQVCFIIPNYAFSAGTVLAMSGDRIYMDYYSRLGPIDPQVPTARGRWVPALGYLIQWQRLLDKAQDGTLTLAEAQLMIEGFDQTETHKSPVTEEMRRARAVAIGVELNNTERWHSHGYGISMAVLQKDLNLRIDDLDQDPERRDKVKQYDGLLSDYMAKRGAQGLLHTVGSYLPFM